MKFIPISDEEERIAKDIVASAYTVHSTLGPGLLESVYEVCFCHELSKKGRSYRRQVVVPIIYDGITFDEGLRLDVLVGELVICELKAVETMHPVFLAQLLTQLKLTQKRIGFLINFNVPLIKQGIKRVVL
jgi:GxxExxY protein